MSAQTEFYNYLSAFFNIQHTPENTENTENKKEEKKEND